MRGEYLVSTRRGGSWAPMTTALQDLTASAVGIVIARYRFFFNDTATTEIYTLSLHDALPIWSNGSRQASDAERRLPATWRPRIRSAPTPDRNCISLAAIQDQWLTSRL